MHRRPGSNSTEPTRSRRHKERLPRRKSRLEPLENRLVFSTTLDTLANVTLLSGAPLNIALNGHDTENDALTFNISSDNPAITAVVPQGNKSLRITTVQKNSSGAVINTFGDMVFQLFDDLAPHTTARIEQLVNAGFYNGVTFHRVIGNFMIQGGDPTGTGSGGSPLDNFDDEFDPDLQFTSKGVLAMAKSGDDTNDSQFFITATATRFLDFQHNIFGFQTAGDSVRAAIAAVPTGANDKPVNPVVMQSVSLFNDTQNGVLRISAPQGTTGTAHITVTASDGNGGVASQTFTVTITPDTNNDQPYLLPIAPIVTTQGTPVTVTLQAVDVEGDPIEFEINSADGVEYSLPPDETSIVVTPVNQVATFRVIVDPSLAGNQQLRIFVRKPGVTTQDDGTVDSQHVPLLVTPAAPHSVTLDTGSDTGIASNDGETKLNSGLKFQVTAIQQGAAVTLRSGDAIIGTGSVTAAANGQIPVLVNIAITLPPGATIPDGTHSITATQTIAGMESVASPALSLVVDTKAPVFTSTPQTVIDIGSQSTYSYNVQTDEETSGFVRYALTTAPTGMTIDPATGQITWQPTLDQFGANNVVVQVTDRAGNTANQSFSVGVHKSPIITPIGNQTINELQTLTLQIVASTTEVPSPAFTYSLIDNVPAGAEISASTGLFTWIPAESQGPGVYPITIRVQDANGLAATATFQVTVADVNQAPVLDPIANQVLNSGGTLTVQTHASDADIPANTLTYSLLAGAPFGMSINPTTGLVTWVTAGTLTSGQYGATVKVTDAGGLFDTKSFTVAVHQATTITPIGDQTINETQTLSVQVVASSTEDPTPSFTYSLTGTVPPGAGIDASTGLLTWTPSEAQGPGVYPITVRVQDSNSLTATATFQVTVGEVDQAPILDVINHQTVNAGGTLAVQAHATDADLPANVLTYSLLDNSPTGMTINPATGLITWVTTSTLASGQYAATVKVADAGGLFDTKSFTIDVHQAPTITPIGNHTIDELQTLTLSVVASTAEVPSPTFTYSLTGTVPPGAGINASTGLFAWTPTEAQGPGDYPITVRVQDSNGLSSTATFQVTVNEVNQAPVLDPLATQSINPGGTFSVHAHATDADLPANTLTYRLLDDAPAGMTINATTGEITWITLATLSAGEYTATVKATDAGGLSDAQRFSVIVNAAPAIQTIGDKTITEGQSLALQVVASTNVTPAPSLSYSLVSNPPSGAQINPATGAFTWTPTEAQGPGVYPITVRVQDSNGLDSTAAFQVTVGEVNQAPVLDPIAGQTVNAGGAFAAQAHASDTDLPANVLTFSLLDGAPAGMTINPTTGVIAWVTPSNQASGQYSATAKVIDAGGLSATQTFVVTVNAAPSIETIADQVVNQGQTLQLQLVASSTAIPTPALAFSLIGSVPSGTQLNPATGLFSWTPTAAQASQSYTVTIRVDDSNGLTATTTFQVTVNRVNHPPTLTVPRSALANPGQEFQLQLQARDSDVPADQLTFTLIDGPAGATVDPTTGLFRWTPPASFSAISAPVTVQVSDNGSPSLSAQETFQISLGSANVGLFPGGGGGLPTSVTPNAALASLSNSVAGLAANTVGVNLVGQTGLFPFVTLAQQLSAPGRMITIQGGDTFEGSLGPSIPIVSEFQVGPDTGLGNNEVVEPRVHRVERPTSDDTAPPADQDRGNAEPEDANGPAEDEPTGGLEVKGTDNQQSRTLRTTRHPGHATQAAPPSDEVADDVTDAALGALESDVTEIVLQRLLTKASAGVIGPVRVFSQLGSTTGGPLGSVLSIAPTEPSRTAVAANFVQSESTADEAGTGEPLPANSSDTNGHLVSRIETAGAAAATLMYLPLLVCELSDDEEEDERPRRFRWRRKPR